MSFTGYCSPAELSLFLDFGNWRTFPIQSYDPTEVYILPTTGSDNSLNYLVDGTIRVYIDGTETEEFTVDLESGLILFNTASAGDNISVVYYINSGFSNSELEFYTLLGARTLESDTNAFYREIEATYATDGNEGLDYINYVNTNTIQLLYNIARVVSLTIDGQTVSPETVKINGTHLSLTRASEKREFSGKANSVVVTVIHGIPDPEAGKEYTDEQQRLIHLAKEANKCISAMHIMDSPIGRNIALDNSYVVQRSDGSVRPDITVEHELRRFAKKYENLINILKQTGSKLI